MHERISLRWMITLTNVLESDYDVIQLQNELSRIASVEL